MSFYSRFNLKKKISQLIRLANWIKITSKYGKFACDYISENSRFLRFLVLYLDEMVCNIYIIVQKFYEIRISKKFHQFRKY